MAKTKLLGTDRDRQLKEQKKIAQQKNKVKRRTPGRFFKDIAGELKKTTWPTGKELMKTTAYVIIFIGILTTIIYLFDWGVASIFQNFLY